MRQTLMSIFFCAFLLPQANAQKTDIFAVRKIIASKFWVDLDTLDLCETIIFNGVPFGVTEIDAQLKKLKPGAILVTKLVDLSGSRLVHKNCSHMIVLGTADHQAKEDKERILGSIRNNLNANVPKLEIHDYKCSQCKQVFVNGRATGIYDAQRMVNKLRAKDIKYITSYESADPAVYGQNAKNGLIEIYLTAKGERRTN